MLDVLDSIFRFVLCILLLIFCLIFAAVGGVLEVLTYHFISPSNPVNPEIIYAL